MTDDEATTVTFGLQELAKATEAIRGDLAGITADYFSECFAQHVDDGLDEEEAADAASDQTFNVTGALTRERFPDIYEDTISQLLLLGEHLADQVLADESVCDVAAHARQYLALLRSTNSPSPTPGEETP